MLKRAGIDTIGPQAKRFRIIRVSQKPVGSASDAVVPFDTSKFVQGLTFLTKSDEESKSAINEVVSSEITADMSNIFDGEVVDGSKGCFSTGADLVVELDCETVEMMNEDVVSDGVVDAEAFHGSSAASFCLSHETRDNHQNHDDDEESRHESNPFMPHFDGGTTEALELIGNGVFTDGVIKVELPDITDTFQTDSCMEDSIIEQAMDITEPLSTLKNLLEERFGFSLKTHEIWLQDSLKLDQNKNLVSQCLEGTGVVQINVEIKSMDGQNPRLNIVDVLKPVDEDEEEEDEEVVQDDDDDNNNQISNEQVIINGMTSSTSSTTTCVTKWMVDSWFCTEQEKLKMPRDPALWTVEHVKFWLRWAVKKFNLESVNSYLLDSIDGAQLISLTHDSFAQIFPNDPGDVFWTHLELLRKCKFVAVMHNEETTSSNTGNNTTSRSNRVHNRTRNLRLSSTGGGDKTTISRFGNNGQIQLWQFLLELLTDKEYRSHIQWVGDNGEFKLVNPEYIAQLWGRRKNKVNMNYEKLSRALRYYYDGDMIAKVHGKRFTYKYVCDLRTLLGYSAAELNRLVNECAKKSGGNSLQGAAFLQTQITL